MPFSNPDRLSPLMTLRTGLSSVLGEGFWILPLSKFPYIEYFYSTVFCQLQTVARIRWRVVIHLLCFSRAFCFSRNADFFPHCFLVLNLLYSFWEFCLLDTLIHLFFWLSSPYSKSCSLGPRLSCPYVCGLSDGSLNLVLGALWASGRDIRDHLEVCINGGGALHGHGIDRIAVLWKQK